MSKLENIAVKVEESLETGNVQPLMHEVLHALRRLLETSEETVIDLRRIPLAPGEERQIEELLGRGEVRAELTSLGPSTIVETRFPGVWLVTHCNENDELVGKFIEVTHAPKILRSQEDDIRDGIGRLEHVLARST